MIHRRSTLLGATLLLGGAALRSPSASAADTVRIVSGYADAIAIRHFEQGTAAEAARISPVPIINAGDGVGEHPTQALTDIYTIKKELGRLSGLRVAQNSSRITGN